MMMMMMMMMTMTMMLMLMTMMMMMMMMMIDGDDDIETGIGKECEQSTISTAIQTIAQFKDHHHHLPQQVHLFLCCGNCLREEGGLCRFTAAKTATKGHRCYIFVHFLKHSFREHTRVQIDQLGYSAWFYS